MCGAAIPLRSGRYSAMGLSPRVRGSLHQRLSFPLAPRSIPTCAGQPVTRFFPEDVRQVYPHVCGAALLDRNSRYALGGLSPRVRGSLHHVRTGPLADGSIPTCAGQPTIRMTYRGSIPVYPHVCGAAPVTISTALRMSGLSPRVRGSQRDTAL